MALKLIQQDAGTLREAFDERKGEYEALRAAGKWSGAVLYAGTLLELALKLAISKHLGVTNLPTIFQVHDLDLLFYCSGQYRRLDSDDLLQENFSVVYKRWSLALRYEGATKTQRDADDFDQALFDSPHGVITFLSQYF
ncbi:hypothetical protein HUU05_28315 [candidate division KSB1 bacterium]|nr:hypothetical protein [candidate division KSB1 bacterium]